MRKHKAKILLFEDDSEQAQKILRLLNRHSGIAAVVFEPTKNESEKAYEDRLREELKTKQYSDVTLIVCDRDLSATDHYQGLSEAVVSKVAALQNLPICLYARGVLDPVLERQRNWGDGRIVLESKSLEEMTRKICILANGFRDLKLRLAKALTPSRKSRLETPSAVMAEILEHPNLADQIALYGSGDQKMISEILPINQKDQKKELAKRLPVVLGYWLYDSILRFPGLIVNRVSAASYLNISVASFKDEIQDLFASAKYTGPFADPQDPHWWRSELDDLVFAAGCEDGKSVVEKQLKRNVRDCVCSVDKTTRAGFYCMVTRQPVSRENSRGNISWFPPGADLARITNSEYEKIGPWLGLY